MDEYMIRIKLLAYCTLRGGLYGLCSGAVTGVFWFVIGAFIGAPIGAVVGLFAGFVNAAVVLLLAPVPRPGADIKRFKWIVYLCCLGTSLVLDGVCYLLNGVVRLNDFLKVVSIMDIPALIVSALCLAGFVVKWYPSQLAPKPVYYMPETGQNVWPPAPPM